MAEAGDCAVDYRGIYFLENIVAETELFHGAGTVVLNNNVGLLYKLFENLFSFGSLEIERAAELASVEVCIINAVFVNKRAHFARIVAAGRVFELNYGRAHIGHYHSAVGACKNTRKVEYNYAVE